MVRFSYEGREWSFRSPGPSFALEIRRLGDAPPEQVMGDITDHLMDYMDLDDWVYLATHGRDLPEDAYPELFMQWLETATGKPMSAVGALSNVAVRSWGIVRGQLVMRGIPDPMSQIPTLAVLLDAVDVMLRRSHKDERETAKYEREVYRPRAKRGSIEKPAGFEKDDMAAQAAMLEAFSD